MRHLQIITSHLGATMLLAIVYATWLLRTFSQRIGEVTRMPHYYMWFDVGNALICGALLSYIFQCSASLAGEPQALLTATFTMFAFYIPLAIGLTINIIVAFTYWGWLVHEK